MKLSQIRDKFWIRKDREDFFFSGLILAAIISATVTSYWHYADRTEIKPKIRLKTEMSKDKEISLLKRAAGTTTGLKSKTTSFYNVETYSSPNLVPEPEDNGQ